MNIHLIFTIIPTSLESHMIHWTRPITYFFLMETLFAASSGSLHCWLLGLVDLGLGILCLASRGFCWGWSIVVLVAVLMLLWGVWWCLFLFPCHLCLLFVFTLPYPSHHPSPAVLALCLSGFVPGVCPSCPRLHSVLSPSPPPPRLLTDPPPPSLAGTPCRTVWRKSIRQSNPESLPSGPSRERWVW